MFEKKADSIAVIKSDPENNKALDQFRKNETCFIRKDHKCGKIYNASKACFVACPTADDIEPILSLISEKLAKVGVETIIAVKERAYGQDIFCTKICGKIIEAKFCIVILDDAIEDGKNIPNPNVYYEYGLMTASNKYIIPLQKKDLQLAFNIQSYDTIKYSLRDIADELDKAIKNAIRSIETQVKAETMSSVSEKLILRCFELAGFELKDNKWYLQDILEDTGFIGYGYHKDGIKVKPFYVYLGKIDNIDDTQSYLEDINITVHRTEKKYVNAEKELNSLNQLYTELSKQTSVMSHK